MLKFLAMKLKILLWAFLALNIIGCSTDDDAIEEPTQKITANYTVIGADEDRVYEFSYNGTTNIASTIDLTSEIGISPNFITFRQQDDVISFYSFSEGTFTLNQKNVETGTTSNFERFYSIEDTRSIVWGIDNETNVFFGYFSGMGTRDIAILDINLTNSESVDTTVAFGVDQLFQPIQHNGKLFLTFRDDLGNHKLTYYDIQLKRIGPSIDFGTTPISIFIDDDENVVVVKNEQNPSLEIYDSNSLTLLKMFQLDFAASFSTGPISNTVLSEEKLYYSFNFSQPSRFTIGPAVYDLVEQDNKVFDFVSIASAVENELGNSIVIIDVSFSVSQRIFLVTYRSLSDTITGGVIQISTDGELLTNTTMPFFPVFTLKD
jgi:hypothetical protein